MSDSTSSQQYDRDELAAIVAAECDRLAEKWWHDRDTQRWALENDPWWEEPRIWLRESRPPVRTCGEVLARILTKYEPGQGVSLVELLEWINRQSGISREGGQRRHAHGFYRAQSALREETGFGWPDPDPVLDELVTDGGTETSGRERLVTDGGSAKRRVGVAQLSIRSSIICSIRWRDPCSCHIPAANIPFTNRRPTSVAIRSSTAMSTPSLGCPPGSAAGSIANVPITPAEMMVARIMATIGKIGTRALDSSGISSPTPAAGKKPIARASVTVPATLTVIALVILLAGSLYVGGPPALVLVVAAFLGGLLVGRLWTRDGGSA